MSVDAHSIEYLREFVHESDIHISLRVLDDFRGLSNLDGGSLVRSVDEDRVVDSVHKVSNLRSTARSYLTDFLHSVLLVAGVDALRRVTGEKVDVELQSADAFHNRETLFLSHSRIDRRFIDNDVPFRDYLAHSIAGSQQRLQVGTIVLVHRSRNSHNVEVAVAYLVQVSRADKTVIADGILKEFVSNLESSVVASHQSIHARLIHIKADSRELGGEQPCERQSHIAKTYYGNFDI